MSERNSRVPSRILVLVRELVRLRSAFSDAMDGDPDLSGKQVAAHRAFVLGNELFNDLTSWAQAHVTGQAMMDDEVPGLNSHLQRELGPGFDKIPHFHERLGSVFHASSSTKSGDAIEKALDSYQEANKLPVSDVEAVLPDLISDAAIRKIAVSVLRPHTKLSSPWRAVLIEGLESLDDGQVPSLFNNPMTPRRAKPADRKQLQIQIIKRIWFEVGRGAAVGKAREMVGHQLGLEADAMRKWEISLRKSPDICNEFDCAEISGKQTKAIQALDPDSQKVIEIFCVYKGTPIIKTALYILYEWPAAGFVGTQLRCFQ